MNIGICGLDLAVMQVRLAAAHELSPSAPWHMLAGPFFLDVASAREDRRGCMTARSAGAATSRADYDALLSNELSVLDTLPD